MEPNARQQRLFEIFHPFAVKKTKKRSKPGKRFVHYTSAENAVSMIVKKEIWMRKASLMNDYMEIEHGMECLQHSYDGENGDEFRQAIDDLFPGISDELQERFNGWLPHFRVGTFLTSLSEHDKSEDEHGRLSMWRSYGGVTGVGVVLNPAVFLTPSDALNAYTSPVAYLNPKEFKMKFDEITTNVMNKTDWLKTCEKQIVLNYLFSMFRFAVLCTKHPGFAEEREWRIIYAPEFEKSKRIIEEIKTIKGIPQTICKLPLKDFPEEGLVGASIPELVERIIVGPNDHAYEVKATFIRLLQGAGMSDASQKVFVSGIPLRSN